MYTKPALTRHRAEKSPARGKMLPNNLQTYRREE